jgi:hypothetical protein
VHALGGGSQSAIVGHDSLKILAHRQRGREVDGIEGPQGAWFESRRGHQNPSVDVDQVKTSEHLTRATTRCDAETRPLEARGNSVNARALETR